MDFALAPSSALQLQVGSSEAEVGKKVLFEGGRHLRQTVLLRIFVELVDFLWMARAFEEVLLEIVPVDPQRC